VVKDGWHEPKRLRRYGKGALEKERLNITGSKPTRIICDLLSGGCNPNEIERLLDLSSERDVQVRHLNRLHAKVYWTPTAAIVGSANASANGLGDEGNLGTIEAALLTDDKVALNAAAAWFEKIWEKAKTIDGVLLAQGREAWLRRAPAPNPEDTVLKVYVNDPEWFRRKLWITYYFSEASDAAEKKFHEIKQLHYSAHQIAKFDRENIPLYDLDRVDASSVNVGDAVIDAADRSFEILEVAPYSKESSIVLLKPKNTVCGLLFPAEQRRLIKQAIEHHIASKEKAAGRRLTDKEKDFGCNIEDLRKEAEDVHSYLVKNFPYATI
jgi:hypothetical protein